MLKSRQVEAFRAVMLAGGITPASELMSVSQPAVTRLIHDLQSALGLKLFERRGARLVPSVEAHLLYREVQRSFVGLDRIQRAAVELRQHRAGVLRIAALPALANGYLPRFVAGFLATRPKLDLALAGAPSTVILDLVAAGQCDVGFVEMPSEHAAIRIEPLVPVPAVAVVPERHPLARKRVLRPRDFDRQPFISFSHATILRYRIDTLFDKQGVRPIYRVETPLSMIACPFVSSELGIAIVDPFTAREHAGRGLAIRPFAPTVPIEFGICYSTQQPLPALARELIRAFSAEVESFAKEFM
jgi:DNA-binding transcriptional LysR family regulator